MDLFEFTRQARAARSAQAVLTLLRSRVLPTTTDAALGPFLRVVMGCARHFNEDLDDVDSAILLWSEVWARSPDLERSQAVIAIMMSVANKRGHASLPAEQRDASGAARIYEALYRLHASPDQDRRVVRTMMDIANRLTDLSLPRARMDVDAAIVLWTAVHRLDVSEADRGRVVRTMMDIANRLTDLREPRQPTDISSAIRIWQGIGTLPLSPEDRKRVIFTILGVATRLSRLDAPKDERDFEAAVRLWQTAWRMARDVDPDLALQVVRTMMDVANRLTDLSGDPADLDVDAAIVIWTGIVEAGEDDEDRARIVCTMMALAGWLLRPEAQTEDVTAALKLYHACWRHSPSSVDRMRVVKTLFDVLSRAPAPRAVAIAVLRDGRAAPEEEFRRSVEAGLLYYQDAFNDVVALVDRLPSPDGGLLALRADALRKLRRIDAALDACNRLLSRPILPGEGALQSRDARVAALCCRGYCFLEKGKTEARFLPRALQDFEAAVRDAERWDLRVPPRALTGPGYVFQLQGRHEEAAAAFERAVRMDQDNLKAWEALGSE
jgi:tetratricopeptide (TPR) repeat protein